MYRQKGFTLVELLVVITIIGILIAIAVPSVNRVRERAKETQVQVGLDDIVRGLELFAQDNGGNYPGVALPICDDDGVEPFEDASGSWGPLYYMRGVIGGGLVPHDPAQTDFFDGFYFKPAPPPPLGMEQIPDRLVSTGAVDNYPNNPFRKNIRGLTNQNIPMINIWGMELDHVIPGPVITDPGVFHISYPLMYDPATPGVYNFPPIAGSINDFSPFYLGDERGVLWDPNQDWKVSEGELQKYFPEGDFAYIPLDPVQRDPQNPQFMRFCRNYWIIGYGSKRSALRNKFADVWPNFPPPLGDGLHNPADPASTLNNFEKAVKNALVGAEFVYGTKYQEQFNVAGND
jgi:prepilin-type N-terminal cleavage/methylation domain-containing protein